MHAHPNMRALRTAIPYIRGYQGRIVIIKLGGRLCEPGPALEHLVEQFSLLASLGIKLVLVHGGGEQLSAWAQRMGHTPQFVQGRRVTDATMLELAKMVFAGSLNTSLVAAFRRLDIPAVGLTGIDAGLICADRRPPRTVVDPSTGDRQEVDYGWVGDIHGTRPALVEHLLNSRFVPVIASLAADAQGRVLNVNADTIAARLAVDLKAEKYILLTSVDGIMLDPSDPTTLQTHLDLDDLDRLTREGVLSGGMLPKAAACADALRGGVPRVHVVNGSVQDALLAELFTNEGSGTLVVLRREKTPAEPAAVRA